MGRKIALTVAMALAAMGLAAAIAAASADAAPRLEIKQRWAPQTLVPGENGLYILRVRNLGDEDTSGVVTATAELPPGVTRIPPAEFDAFFGLVEGVGWECEGTGTVTCTTEKPVEAFDETAPRSIAWTTGNGRDGAPGYAPQIYIRVEVDAEASGEHTVTANASGGGSAAAVDEDPVRIAAEPTGFGFTPGSAEADVFDAEYPDGSPARQAGAHPYELRVNFDLNMRAGEVPSPAPGLVSPQAWSRPVQNVRTVRATLPKGLIGNPEATPKCTPVDFLREGSSPFTSTGCAPETQVGTITLMLNSFGGDVTDHGDHWFFSPASWTRIPVYNLEPPPGYPADFGFMAGDYRGHIFILEADNYVEQGKWVGTDVKGQTLDVEGCDDQRIRFHPDVELQPTSRAAGGPTGLKVNLKVPQRNDTVANAQELYEHSGDIQAIATPPLKKAVVTMPEGMTISTSAAQGLGNCSLEQLKLGTNEPVTCPANSQYGTLTLRTPILPEDAPMTGKIYVAKQDENPFNSFLALYLVVQDPQRGLLVKIPGKVDLHPVTGQITTTFDDLPEFPVSDMEMTLKGGVRAALVNPSTCGTKTITATFYSWARPNQPITKSSSYQVTDKAGGGPCAPNLAGRPFNPAVDAGTVNPVAGAYSPFGYRVQRSDDDQELSALRVTLPKGLLAKIGGIAKCSDAAIAAAEAPGRSGAAERDNPSCPAASEIGSTQVGSGVGQVITYIGGKAYLAGPYKGAPLSMVVISPILAGPYDLGVIAVRSAIHVDPESTEVTVQSDPLPQIFKGIPVRIRDVRVNVDRGETMLNPTNCVEKAIASRVIGAGGDVNNAADDTAADVSVRFQVANCARLGFKPRLALRLKGGTKRGQYPQLTATLTARPGDANIARAAVTLPRSEFLAQEHIRTVCTRVQFAADNCPKAAIYGRARAITPLFDRPLEGPVYLRSSSNPLPDLVAKLAGEVTVVLSGRIDSKNRGIRNTFDVVPDAPVTKFVLRMQGGKKGLLVNSRDICRSTYRADARFRAQNGKRLNLRPVLAAPCKKKVRRGNGRKR